MPLFWYRQKSRIENLVSKYSFENLPKKSKGKGKFARAASPGNWRENFSKDEQKLVNKIMDQTLKELGYEK